MISIRMLGHFDAFDILMLMYLHATTNHSLSTSFECSQTIGVGRVRTRVNIATKTSSQLKTVDVPGCAERFLPVFTNVAEAPSFYTIQYSKASGENISKVPSCNVFKLSLLKSLDERAILRDGAIVEPLAVPLAEHFTMHYCSTEVYDPQIRGVV